MPADVAAEALLVVHIAELQAQLTRHVDQYLGEPGGCATMATEANHQLCLHGQTPLRHVGAGFPDRELGRKPLRALKNVTQAPASLEERDIIAQLLRSSPIF